MITSLKKTNFPAELIFSNEAWLQSVKLLSPIMCYRYYSKLYLFISCM